jgi:hypothetical protein
VPGKRHTALVSAPESDEEDAAQGERRRRVCDRLRFCETGHLRARWKINQTNETNWSGNARQLIRDRRRRQRLLYGAIRNNAARRSRAANVGNRRLVRVEMRATSRAGRVKKHSADRDHEDEPTEHAESLA